MKNLIFILSILIAGAASGHNNSSHSTLTVNLWNNSMFKVVLNNVNHLNSYRFQKRGLRKGNHRMKMVQIQRQGCGYGTVKRVLYNGFVNVPACSDVTVNLKQCGTLERYVEPRFCASNGCAPGHGHGGNNNGYGYNDYGYDYTDGPGYNYGPGNNGGNSCGTGSYGWDVGNRAMSQNQFERLLRSIDNATFDSDQLAVAKSALNGNLLTTNQIMRVMDEYSFESTKLNFAKFAYHRCIDPQNYFAVSDALTFSSDKRKLARYISGV